MPRSVCVPFIPFISFVRIGEPGIEALPLAWRRDGLRCPVNPGGTR